MENTSIDNEKADFISWKIKEYSQPERNRRWYIIAAIFAFLCLFFSFFTISSWKIVFLGYNSNFLFALIIAISSILIIVHEKREPAEMEFKVDGEGVYIGKQFYDYDDIKDFSLLYKPKSNLKKLYFEFKNPVRPRISLELEDRDPIAIRNFLLRYLKEDLDRTNEPLSEQLTKLFKL